MIINNMSAEIQNIKDSVRVHIENASFAEKTKIKDSTLIFKEGFFDSMGFVVLITFLEEKFGIATTDEDLIEENFESINAITDFVVKKKN
jgi:acyl carrier protein